MRIERLTPISQNDRQFIRFYLASTFNVSNAFFAIGVLDDIRARFIDSRFHLINCKTIQPGCQGRLADKFTDFLQVFIPAWYDHCGHLFKGLEIADRGKLIAKHLEQRCESGKVERRFNVRRNLGQDDFAAVITPANFLSVN